MLEPRTPPTIPNGGTRTRSGGTYDAGVRREEERLYFLRNTIILDPEAELKQASHAITNKKVTRSR